jgi:TonB-linked SusC/RagA family outer membrane protein
MNNIQSYRKRQSLLKTGLLSLLFIGSAVAFGQGSDNIKVLKPATASSNYSMKSISGVVTDAATGLPLAGVHVQAYGNEKYTAMTGEDGSYTVHVPDFVTSLAMSVEGYNMVQCAINKRKSGVNVSLGSESFSKIYRDKTSATKSNVAEGFDLSSDLSIEPQIQAKLGSDVRTITRSGMTGIGATMYMNGLNSLSANAQPLIVLDGILLDMQYNRSMVHDGNYNNLLANINVNDIEKVTVVKNGTAIYGANGANGVILIDTKRNKSMATKIDLTVFGGYELIPTLPSMMDASQYRSYASELLGTTGTLLTDFKFLKVDPDYYYYNQYHNNTDWTKETYRNAFTQSYSINVQGGDDVADYNLSVGYTDGNSTLKKNDFSRFNLRLNSDINLFKNLTARFDASFSDVQRDLRDDGVTDDFKSSTITSPGFLSLIKSPFLNPYAYDTQGNQSSFYADADDYLNEVLGTNVSLANPSSILKYGEAKNKNSFSNSIINLAITPKYQINKYLMVSEHFSYTSVNTYENYYLPMTGVPTFTVDNAGKIANIAQSLASRQNEFFSDTKMAWENKYGASSIKVFGGVRFMDNTYALTLQKGFNTGNDKMPNMSLSLYDKTTSGADDKCRSLTYYANADYNFQEKYYLTGSLSMETSSAFGKDANEGLKLGGVAWGLFPSVQGAWVVSSEPWFDSSHGINYLKLNVGYDISGNDDLDYTASRSYFTANYMLSSIDGLSIGNIGNTTLQWETTKRLTCGFEMNLLNNRLNVQANLFKGVTTNLLTLKELAYVSGLPSNWSNDGSLENTGYDITLNAKILNHKNWKWEMGASAAHYNNKITTLPDNTTYFTTDIYGATVLSQVGSPVGLFYGYRTEGVYSTTDQANADGYYVVTGTGEKKYFAAGDMKFVDTTPDKEINTADRTVIGDPNPDLYGTFFTDISYKKLTLNLIFNYSVGNDVFNYERSILESGNRFYNQTTAITNRWTCEGQATNIPKISYGDEMGNSRFSDRWIEDGSYLRLKTVRLSYALPLNNTYIQGFTIWGSANNLFTFTKYLGSDPEFSLGNSVLCQGIDRGLLAQGRNFTLGVKINL